MLVNGYILSQVSARSFMKPMHAFGEQLRSSFKICVKFYLIVVKLLKGMISASNP
jgi:hypothetical protein